MVAYSLECVECNTDFRTRAQWLEHLLEPSHDQRRSSEVERSLESDKLRKCALVVYATFSVVNRSREVLDFFSFGEQGWLVADFVASTLKPRVGIICFESRKIADKVYAAVGGPQVRICNQLAEIRKGADFLNLEWSELLSSIWSRSYRPDESATGTAVPTSTGNPEGLSVPEVSSSSSSTPVDPRRALIGGVEDIEVNLIKAFKEICLHVDLSRNQHEYFKRAARTLDKAFRRRFYTAKKLSMFRACGYQLSRSSIGRVAPCFYFELADPEKEVEGFATIKHLRNLKCKRGKRAKVFEYDFGVSSKQLWLHRAFGVTSTFDIGSSFLLQFTCEDRNNTLFVMSGEEYQIEAESDKLYQYLLTFNPRARPLLSLVRFCESKNRVHFDILQMVGRAPNLNSNPNTSVSASLFLLMFYLSHKKLIPTPGEVLKDCPPQRLRVVHGVNLGFRWDEKYRNDWIRSQNFPPFPKEGSAAFVLDILDLATEYFQFCSKLAENNWILNTRDGELLSTSPVDLLVSPSLSKFRGQFCSEERKRLKADFFDMDVNSWRDGSGVGCNSIILHPLVTHACFQLGDAFFGYESPVLKLCAANLTSLTARFRHSGLNKATNADDELEWDLLRAIDLDDDVRETLLKDQNRQACLAGKARKQAKQLCFSGDYDFIVVDQVND